MALPASNLLVVIATALALIPICLAADIGFTYDGVNGTESWGTLCPACAVCATGHSQSPINIVSNQTTLNPTLQLAPSYVSANATLVNNEYNVEVVYDDDGGTLNVNNKDHALDYFHLHVPSEHLIDGHQFAAELHLVHKAVDGSTTVLAILYELGTDDPFISQIEGALDTITDDPAAEFPIGSVLASTILPSIDSFYRYNGSLTTPACQEGVVWSVLSQARNISAEQVAAIRASLAEDNKENNRPIQALNGRTVERLAPASQH